MESAPNARARFSCKEKIYRHLLTDDIGVKSLEKRADQRMTEGLYMKDRFC